MLVLYTQEKQMSAIRRQFKGGWNRRIIMEKKIRAGVIGATGYVGQNWKYAVKDIPFIPMTYPRLS